MSDFDAIIKGAGLDNSTVTLEGIESPEQLRAALELMGADEATIEAALKDAEQFLEED